MVSLDDPAEGKVREMVEVAELGSVMIVRPLERVVWVGLEEDGVAGVVTGVPGNSSDAVR
jgi:hypothetical protein